MKLYMQYSSLGFSNTYIMGPEGGGPAIVIDPGSFNVEMLNNIERNGYSVESVLVTHNHINHLRGLSTLLKVYPATIYSSSTEILDYPSVVVNDRQVFQASGFSIEAIGIPGHSPDSMAFRVNDAVFTGDSLTSGLTGSTNSAYAARQLLVNLWQKILSLPDETILFPGHGPPSNVHAERLYNLGLTEPTQRSKARYRSIDLMLEG